MKVPHVKDAQGQFLDIDIVITQLNEIKERKAYKSENFDMEYWEHLYDEFLRIIHVEAKYRILENGDPITYTPTAPILKELKPGQQIQVFSLIHFNYVEASVK